MKMYENNNNESIKFEAQVLEIFLREYNGYNIF